MEWDVLLTRQTPFEARARLSEAEYARNMELLPSELRCKNVAAVEHAARSVAQHCVFTSDGPALGRLLSHRTSAAPYAAVASLADEHVSPLADHVVEPLVSLLYAQSWHTRDHAKNRLLSCLTESVVARWGDAIVHTLAGRPSSPHMTEVIEKLWHNGVDVREALPGLVRYLGRRGGYRHVQLRIAQLLRSIAEADKEGLAAVREALSHGGRAGRVELARHVLRAIEGRDSSQALWETVSNPDVDIRRLAARELVQRAIASDDSEELHHLLEHPDSEVQLVALRGVRNLDIAPYVDALLDVLLSLPEGAVFHVRTIEDCFELRAVGPPYPVPELDYRVLERFASRIVERLSSARLNTASLTLVSALRFARLDISPLVPALLDFLGRRARENAKHGVVNLLKIWAFESAEHADILREALATTTAGGQATRFLEMLRREP